MQLCTEALAPAGLPLLPLLAAEVAWGLADRVRLIGEATLCVRFATRHDQQPGTIRSALPQPIGADDCRRCRLCHC